MKNYKYMDEFVAEEYLSNVLEDVLKDNGYESGRDLVIMCVGTNKCVGDSLGAFVGSYLDDMDIFNVYGTLIEPVHALNLHRIENNIYKEYENPFILAVDAGVGKEESVGRIYIKDYSLKPGTGMDKDLGEVGDVHIQGIVCEEGCSLDLFSVELSFIKGMAGLIVNIICNTVISVENELVNII